MPVPMTLEELDVYGSLENVPYSLDNTFYNNGTTICGPWTLDQLDYFGSLDNLPFSLDDPVWTTGACFNLAGLPYSAGFLGKEFLLFQVLKDDFLTLIVRAC